MCFNESTVASNSWPLPQGYGFHKLLKLSNHLSTVQDPVYNISHRDVIKKCISDPCVFYGDLINKAK